MHGNHFDVFEHTRILRGSTFRKCVYFQRCTPSMILKMRIFYKVLLVVVVWKYLCVQRWSLWICLKRRIFCKGVPLGITNKYACLQGCNPWICLDMRMFYIGWVTLGTVWKCMYFQGGTSPGFDENIHCFFTKGIFKNCMQIRVFPRGRLLDLFGKVYILQGGTFRDCMNTLWIWLKIRAFS